MSKLLFGALPTVLVLGVAQTCFGGPDTGCGKNQSCERSRDTRDRVDRDPPGMCREDKSRSRSCEERQGPPESRPSERPARAEPKDPPQCNTKIVEANKQNPKDKQLACTPTRQAIESRQKITADVQQTYDKLHISAKVQSTISSGHRSNSNNHIGDGIDLSKAKLGLSYGRMMELGKEISKAASVERVIYERPGELDVIFVRGEFAGQSKSPNTTASGEHLHVDGKVAKEYRDEAEKAKDKK